MFLGVLYGLAAGALWGLIFLVSKILTDYTAADIALGRFVVCGIISIVVLAPQWKSLRRVMTLKLWGQALLLACLSYSFYFLALAQAIKYAGLVPVTLIIGVLPITIPLLSHKSVVNRGQFYISIAMVACGLVILNWPLLIGFSLPADIRGHWLAGLGMAVCALALWTVYAPLNARVLARHPEMDSSMWSSLLGVGAMLTIIPIWIFLNPDMGVPERLFDSRYLLWMLAAGIGSSWLAGVLWNLASRRIPPALAGQLIVSETIFSLIYSYVYDKQMPIWTDAAASVVLICGVLTGIHAFQKKTEKTAT
jgi:drug/metabolite transporter (DMT)-like permease